MSLMEQDKLSVRTQRRFSREFKADAVALVLDGERPIAGVAGDLGIGANNLGNWVRQARIDRGDKPGLTTEERVELTRLRRENAKLRMERELLKRATDFWVQESGLHLAVVLDIGSRRVIGYSMAADMPARLVIDALNTAAASRGGRTTGVIFHSDRLSPLNTSAVTSPPRYADTACANLLAGSATAGTTASPSRSSHR